MFTLLLLFPIGSGFDVVPFISLGLSEFVHIFRITGCIKSDVFFGTGSLWLINHKNEILNPNGEKKNKCQLLTIADPCLALSVAVVLAASWQDAEL